MERKHEVRASDRRLKRLLVPAQYIQQRLGAMFGGKDDRPIRVVREGRARPQGNKME